MRNDKIYKDYRLTVFVTDELGIKLRREARKKGLSISSYCMSVLKKHVEENLNR